MPLQLLLSRTAAERFGARIATILEGDDFQLIHVEDLDARNREISRPIGPNPTTMAVCPARVSPHSASRSGGNYDRVGEIFLDNLARWRDQRQLRNRGVP